MYTRWTAAENKLKRCKLSEVIIKVVSNQRLAKWTKLWHYWWYWREHNGSGQCKIWILVKIKKVKKNYKSVNMLGCPDYTSMADLTYDTCVIECHGAPELSSDICMLCVVNDFRDTGDNLPLDIYTCHTEHLKHLLQQSLSAHGGEWDREVERREGGRGRGRVGEGGRGWEREGDKEPMGWEREEDIFSNRACQHTEGSETEKWRGEREGEGGRGRETGSQWGGRGREIYSPTEPVKQGGESDREVERGEGGRGKETGSQGGGRGRKTSSPTEPVKQGGESDREVERGEGGRQGEPRWWERAGEEGRQGEEG